MRKMYTLLAAGILTLSLGMVSVSPAYAANHDRLATSSKSQGSAWLAGRVTGPQLCLVSPRSAKANRCFQHGIMAKVEVWSADGSTHLEKYDFRSNRNGSFAVKMRPGVYLLKPQPQPSVCAVNGGCPGTYNPPAPFKVDVSARMNKVHIVYSF